MSHFEISREIVRQHVDDLRKAATRERRAANAAKRHRVHWHTNR
jgi:hypothetical protein